MSKISEERLDRVLIYVHDFIAKNNYAPVIREICENTGVPSTASVSVYLKRLESLNLIQAQPRKFRTLRLTESGLDRVRELKEQ